MKHLPEDEILVFLRAKRGEGEEGLYRLVNSTGLWVGSDDGVTAPLAEDLLAADEKDSEPYPNEVRDISSLDELADAATTTS